MKYDFKVPGPRSKISKSSSKQSVTPLDYEMANLILHALIVRLAYNDDRTEEFYPKLIEKLYEIDIPQERLDNLTTRIEVGPKIQQFIDWLTGSRISDIEEILANFPIASKTQYGIVEIGDGIDVANGVISISTGVGWETVVTDQDYTIQNNPTAVIAKDGINVTLPTTDSVGYRAVVKNSTSDQDVNIIGNIDGNVNPSLGPREAVSLVFDGSIWNIV